MSQGTTSEYTLNERMRLPIKWAYCPPKSRIKMVSIFNYIPQVLGDFQDLRHPR